MEICGHLKEKVCTNTHIGKTFDDMKPIGYIIWKLYRLLSIKSNP